MTDTQYAELINRGVFLYWDMLGNLHGITNHNEDGLYWLSGDVEYNYFTSPAFPTNAANIDNVVLRMKNKEIPNNLTFLTNDLTCDPAEPFRETGMFKDDTGTTGMAHDLTTPLDTPITENEENDKKIDIFRVNEISQLKTAGAILNGVFSYRLFSFSHYLEMMNNHDQYFYIAEYDGLPVGACMSQHGDCFVIISWVTTLPGYRKLGIAGRLIQLAEKDALHCGKNTGVLHARPGAIGAYKRVGYREYCRGIELELKEELAGIKEEK